MLEWKRAESEDLIAERTRLKHGELSHQEGADDQVFQFLLMQAQQVGTVLRVLLVIFQLSVPFLINGQIFP